MEWLKKLFRKKRPNNTHGNLQDFGIFGRAAVDMVGEDMQEAIEEFNSRTSGEIRLLKDVQRGVWDDEEDFIYNYLMGYGNYDEA